METKTKEKRPKNETPLEVWQQHNYSEWVKKDAAAALTARRTAKRSFGTMCRSWK